MARLAVLAFVVFSVGVTIVLDAEKKEAERSIADRPAVQAQAVSVREAIPDSLTRIVRTASGVRYALSAERGVLVSYGGTSWVERNKDLPLRVVYPFSDLSVRRLIAIGIDPIHPDRVAVTTADEIYLSENYGVVWEKIPTGKPLRSSSYFTSVALSSQNPAAVLVGTSFNGFFETRDRGKSWQDPSLKARFLYRGAGFWEEISGVSYHPLDQDRIIFSCGFGHGLYIGSSDRSLWSRLDFPGEERGEITQSLQVYPDSGEWSLEVQTDRTLRRYSLADRKWRLPESTSEERTAIDPLREERLRTASDKFGIYVSSYQAAGEELERHLDFISQHGLNSIVVDFKDDFGRLTYDTALELPYRVGAVDQRFQVDVLISKAHERGIYVVARIVVFKDRQLYNYAGHRYAIWDQETDGPWRNLIRVEKESREEGGVKTAKEKGREMRGRK